MPNPPDYNIDMKNIFLSVIELWGFFSKFYKKKHSVKTILIVFTVFFATIISSQTVPSIIGKTTTLNKINLKVTIDASGGLIIFTQ